MYFGQHLGQHLGQHFGYAGESISTPPFSVVSIDVEVVPQLLTVDVICANLISDVELGGLMTDIISTAGPIYGVALDVAPRILSGGDATPIEMTIEVDQGIEVEVIDLSITADVSVERP